jgi:uncharacterized membrane protein YedE/YeeE
MLMTEFTPISATVGGLLIGLAAAALLLLNGRVAGISGILGGALRDPAAEGGWRVAFLVGLPLGAVLVSAMSGGLAVAIAASPAALIVAGLLVGFGTQLGSGCTSGHGVCGMARGSRRSIAATLTFMSSGAATVYLVRHVIGASL